MMKQGGAINWCSRNLGLTFRTIPVQLYRLLCGQFTTEDIGYYDYRTVTLLFACFISFQCYALS